VAHRRDHGQGDGLGIEGPAGRGLTDPAAASLTGVTSDGVGALGWGIWGNSRVISLANAV